MTAIHGNATLHAVNPVQAVKPADDAINAILESLLRIRFGSIAVTVHEGKVVQLDITEKRRLAR